MKILRIDCSPRAGSHSRRLSAAIVERILSMEPTAEIVHRDLGLEPIPHTRADYAAALASPATLMTASSAAIGLSEELIQELEVADLIVIGTPMNNFTVPSVLKAWIDQVLRMGRTIISTEEGKVGVLADRPVIVGIASGGVFWGKSAKQPDFLTPYLTAALGCIGLRSLHYLPLQATALLSDLEIEAARRALLPMVDAMIVSKTGSPRADATFVRLS